MAALKIKRDAGENLTDCQLARLTKAEDEDALHETLYHLASGFDTRLGRVYKTSGVGENAIKSEYLRDWGVVQMDSKRIKDLDGLSQLNVSHNRPTDVLEKQYALSFECNGT